MMTVMIESPLEGGSARETDNIEYAKRCLNDSLARGEAPFLSHLLYTHTLDDTIPEQRERGIRAGHVMGRRLEAWIFYLDRGVTRGMFEGIDAAIAAGFRPYRRDRYDFPERPIIFRSFQHLQTLKICEDGVFETREIQAAAELMLHECMRWPLLLAHFEKHARREWDLPQ